MQELHRGGEGSGESQNRVGARKLVEWCAAVIIAACAVTCIVILTTMSVYVVHDVKQRIIGGK